MGVGSPPATGPWGSRWINVGLTIQGGPHVDPTAPQPLDPQMTIGILSHFEATPVRIHQS